MIYEKRAGQRKRVIFMLPTSTFDVRLRVRFRGTAVLHCTAALLCVRALLMHQTSKAYA